jgi:hypothetical protein
MVTPTTGMSRVDFNRWASAGRFSCAGISSAFVLDNLFLAGPGAPGLDAVGLFGQIPMRGLEEQP